MNSANQQCSRDFWFAQGSPLLYCDVTSSEIFQHNGSKNAFSHLKWFNLSYTWSSLLLVGFSFVRTSGKEKVLHSCFTLHFTSATEHLQWYLRSMGLYSFPPSYEAVLQCTGVNSCNTKWELFPLHPNSGASHAYPDPFVFLTCI